MWVDDARGACLCAKQLRRLIDAEDLDAARSMRDEVQRRATQVASELQSRADALDIEAYQDAFAHLLHEVSSSLTDERRATPLQRARRTDESSFVLHCAVCADPAVTLTVGVGKWSSQPALLYAGITVSTELPFADAEVFFSLLDRDDVAAAHERVKSYRALEDGIDGYCPDCDKIYCRNHYAVQETFDEGFYDCAYGTCPEGHRRIIDD